MDTGAFVGRYLGNDQHHEAAVTGWRRLQAEGLPFCTTNLVLSETLTLLARLATPGFAVETGRLIYASATLRIVRPGEVDERRAIELMGRYADQCLSFCDAVSVVLMRQHRIKEAFSFDHHFALAGFRLWG